LTAIVLIAALAMLANWVAKRILLRAIDQIVARTPWEWDNALRDNRVFIRFSHLAPAAVSKLIGKGLFADTGSMITFVNALVMVYVVVIVLLVASAVLNTIQRYLEIRVGNSIPVKGFAQAIKLIAFIIGSILVLSIIFGKSPVYFLSGLGAL